MKPKKGLTMQISIDVQDDIYKEVLSSGLDMQSEFNEYLRSQLEITEYVNSTQYQKDKADLQEAYEELESGKVEALSHEEVWEAIEKHTQER